MNDVIPYLKDSDLTAEQKDTAQQMAALSFTVEEIAHALELRDDIMRSFIRDADVPESVVCNLIQEGRVMGRANHQIKLFQLSEAGNVDAIKELKKVQIRNRFHNLLNAINEDELYAGDSIWGETE